MLGGDLPPTFLSRNCLFRNNGMLSGTAVSRMSEGVLLGGRAATAPRNAPRGGGSGVLPRPPGTGAPVSVWSDSRVYLSPVPPCRLGDLALNRGTGRRRHRRRTGVIVAPLRRGSGAAPEAPRGSTSPPPAFAAVGLEAARPISHGSTERISPFVVTVSVPPRLRAVGPLGRSPFTPTWGG